MNKKFQSLSKFLAVAGVCARRKATELIKDGAIKVNGVIETNPAYRVQLTDIVFYKNQQVKLQQKFLYILLNKPAGYVTTVSDERGHKTVLDLIQLPGGERVYPIGRLDKETTGLLLLTNDGIFAQQLAHPRYEVAKTYQIRLDKEFLVRDALRIEKGVMLEDGLLHVDALDINSQQPTEVIVTLHSGKNRIVRRLFKILGYYVQELDRINYAGLTFKGLRRGQWRFLTDNEVRALKSE